MTLINPDAESVIGTGALARLLGVSQESVRQLTARGVINQINGPRSAYPLITAVNAYCAHQREQAAGRNIPAEMQLAKLTREKAKANQEVMKTRQMAAELLPADKIEQQWVSIVRVTASSLRALPSRIANRLNLDNQSKSIVADEIDEALNDLADNGASLTQESFHDDTNSDGESDAIGV